MSINYMVGTSLNVKYSAKNRYTIVCIIIQFLLDLKSFQRHRNLASFINVLLTENRDHHAMRR